MHKVEFQRVQAIYGNFALLDEVCPPDPVDASTGLVVTYPAGGIVLTGIDTGTVWVSVEAHDTPPRHLDLDEWDDVVEVDLVSRNGQLSVSSPEGTGYPDLASLASAGPGTYRLRAAVRGRDDHGTSFEDSNEEYLLQCWPEAPSAARAFKTTDSRGAEMRQAYSGGGA